MDGYRLCNTIKISIFHINLYNKIKFIGTELTNSRKTIHQYHICDMLHVFAMVPMSIFDPSFVKCKVFLGKDAGNDDHMT